MLKPHFLKSLEITELLVHQKTLKGSQWWRVYSHWKADGPVVGCHLWSSPSWNTKKTKMHIFRNNLKRSKINNRFSCTIHKVTGPCKEEAQSRGQLPSWGQQASHKVKWKTKVSPKMGPLFTGTITAQAHEQVSGHSLFQLRGEKFQCSLNHIPLLSTAARCFFSS